MQTDISFSLLFCFSSTLYTRIFLFVFSVNFSFRHKSFYSLHFVAYFQTFSFRQQDVFVLQIFIHGITEFYKFEFIFHVQTKDILFGHFVNTTKHKRNCRTNLSW